MIDQQGVVHTLEFGRLSPSLSRAFQDTPFCVLCMMCLGGGSEGEEVQEDRGGMKGWRDERLEG